MRELEPQVNEGDDDTVGERQVVVRLLAARLRSCPRRPRSRSSPAFIQGPDSSPVSLASVWGRSPVQIRCDKAVRAHLDDTSRSFRAACHFAGADTPQTPAMPQKSIAHQAVTVSVCDQRLTALPGPPSWAPPPAGRRHVVDLTVCCISSFSGLFRPVVVTMPVTRTVLPRQFGSCRSQLLRKASWRSSPSSSRATTHDVHTTRGGAHRAT